MKMNKLFFGAIAVTVCACGAAAANFAPDEQGFIRDWLVAGPYPNYLKDDAHQGFATDFLGGEALVKPRAGDAAKATFKADLSVLVTQVGGVNEWGYKKDMSFDAGWRELHAEKGVVSLNRRFAPIDDHFVAYAACYVDFPSDRTLLVFCGSDDDHRVWVNSSEIGASETSQGAVPGYFKYVARLRKGVNRILMKVCDRDSDCGFCVQLMDLKTYKPITDYRILLDPGEAKTVLDAERARALKPSALAAKRKDLLSRKAKAERELAELVREAPGLSNAVAAAEARLAKAYATVERRFAEAHARAAAKGAKSVDLPLEPASTRRELLLNGDWKGSTNGKKWTEDFRLPSRMPGTFFTSWFWPVKPSDPKNRFSRPVFASAAFADKGEFSPLFYASKSRFRTTFDWDGEGAAVFRAEAIVGFAELLVNGVTCGTYDGLCGIWRVPMASARRGRNEIELRFEQRSRAYHKTQMNGIRGDLYVEFVPRVRVEDVYVRPSWRTASLGAELELTNGLDRAADVTVRSYAVRDGRIRLALPERRVTIAAGASAAVSNRLGWADPVLWGPGGAYGDPELYELVTDVSVGGRIVDRHRQPFGFREFWIHATDFFLNGRRIILQGDVGGGDVAIGRFRDVFWPLLRADGINTIRYHDGDYWDVNAVVAADRMGMLTYAQCYPVFPDSAEEPMTERQHDFNRANYLRWWRTLRNHPSVVIWSLDNEVFTQGKHQPKRLKKGIRDDTEMGRYEKWLHGVDPTLVLTRDGDGGTWYETEPTWTDPPAMTANYHYPDYSIARHVVNWRKTFAYRPAIFGETLYCAYGAFDQNVGAIPTQVTKKAAKVRAVASLYRRLGVPAPIFMGLSGDGFFQLDDSGRGNPWGLTEKDRAAYNANGTLPAGFAEDEYPNMRVRWPSKSGTGERILARRLAERRYGHANVNWNDARHPSHVRNKVNDAYRDSLIPQPPLRTGTDAEAIVRAAPGADVWSEDADGVCRGVRADADGLAWFVFGRGGRIVFSADGFAPLAVDVPCRGERAVQPGFEGIPRFELKRKD